jgi:hypothetical protein
MKYLAFEREIVLEGGVCPKCQGDGRVARAGVCWSCNALGRKITLAGRELFYQVCELLGRPIYKKESRIDVLHLGMVSADRVAVGMRVGDTHPSRREMGLVTAVERTPDARVVVRLESGTVIVKSSQEPLKRELTDPEIDRAQVFMAHYMGKGAEWSPEEKHRQLELQVERLRDAAMLEEEQSSPAELEGMDNYPFAGDT